MKSHKKTIILLCLTVLITVCPLIFLKNSDFGGADGKAETVITDIDSDYTPWFSSIFEPSGETESMLFALQAAIGGGIIGFGFGRLSAKKRDKEETSKD